MIENLLSKFEEAIKVYDPNKFTVLNDEWRNLVGFNNYYRWLWSAVLVLQPKNVVEIGRERGVSTVIMLDALPQDSQLQSIDIVECTLSVGEPCFVHNLQDRRLVLITGSSIEVADLVQDGIDFLFIDGDHTGEYVTKEWEIYKAKLAKTAIVVFDDIHFNESMSKFWDSITDEKYDISNWHEKGFGVVFIGYE
jgi:predicted O-methyltransferase YrrM